MGGASHDMMRSVSCKKSFLCNLRSFIIFGKMSVKHGVHNIKIWKTLHIPLMVGSMKRMMYRHSSMGGAWHNMMRSVSCNKSFQCNVRCFIIFGKISAKHAVHKLQTGKTLHITLLACSMRIRMYRSMSLDGAWQDVTRSNSCNKSF